MIPESSQRFVHQMVSTGLGKERGLERHSNFTLLLPTTEKGNTPRRRDQEKSDLRKSTRHSISKNKFSCLLISRNEGARKRICATKKNEHQSLQDSGKELDSYFTRVPVNV